VPFASAISQHPIASQAIGEVSGAVLESIGDRPDLVLVTVTRPHAGALEDIVSTVSAVLHPLAILGCAAESVLGPHREVEQDAAVTLFAGHVGLVVIPLMLFHQIQLMVCASLARRYAARRIAPAEPLAVVPATPA